MSFPVGTKDGPFMKFKGWDILGFDVAFYRQYAGQVDQLKKIFLQKQPSNFYAFNSVGYIKALDTIDSSMLTKNDDCDLYIRVDYPGWMFFQGQDSYGNDLKQITDVTTATARIARIDVLFPADELNRQVAAFNTDGWVKKEVVYPLTPMSQPTSLSGIYVRTDFRFYNFFEECDSSGGDIKRVDNLTNHVPDLIKTLDQSYPVASSGFNTAGWLKDKVQLPPTNNAFEKPIEGLYIRTEWDGFVYLPGLVSTGGDIEQLPGKQVWELIAEARRRPEVVAFNTNGWLKSSLANDPTEPTPGQPVLFGTYVKFDAAVLTASNSLVIDVDWMQMLHHGLFLLKGSVHIWGFWLLPDAPVRLKYAEGVSAMCQDVLRRVQSGKITPQQGVHEAFGMRQIYLVDARQVSSSLGRLFAESIKPAGAAIVRYLDKYSNDLFSRSFADIVDKGQRNQVFLKVIQASGRANPAVTAFMAKAGQTSRVIAVIGVAISLYKVALADDWSEELDRQVNEWVRAMLAGEVGFKIGRLVGPVGAALGGIIGGLLGGWIAEATETAVIQALEELQNWFYGGEQTLEATDILRPWLEQSRQYVQNRMKGSLKQFHVHQVLASQLSMMSTDLPTEAAIAKMLDTYSQTDPAPKADTDDKVVATIVWIISDGAIPWPANPANCRDLMALLDWAYVHLPQNAPTYLQDISVIYTDTKDPPEDCIKELNHQHPDINYDFGGKYVWLIPKRTNMYYDGCTYIEIQITDHAISGQQDLASGAGGKYRYLKLYHDDHEAGKITEIALYRKYKSDGPVKPAEVEGLGFNRVSTDINQGRGGDYLHLIWKA